MPTLDQRLRRLEQQAGAQRTPLEITDAVRAQSALELAEWRAQQRAAIIAWKAQQPADGSHIGHVGLT
jgi:hypothetical protein